MSKKENKQFTIYDIYFDEDRELHKTEKANTYKKVYEGYIDVNMFRHNLFSGTSTGVFKKYKTAKLIYETSTIKVYVTHPLHQKHADVLSLLFFDSIRFKQVKFKSDGGYYLYTRLYQMAISMGYKNPKGSVTQIKKWLSDLRDTDFIIKEKNPNKVGRDDITEVKILSERKYIGSDDIYQIEVSANSARVLAMSVAVKMDKTLNEKIIEIPDDRPKIKALIRYILSQTTLKNGFTLEHIFDKFDIGKRAVSIAKTGNGIKNLSTIRKERSIFKKQLNEYKYFLNEFNINFDKDKQKFYYKQHELIIFEMGIKPAEIVAFIQENQIDKFVGKWIQPKDNVLAKITHIADLENNNFYIEATIAKTDQKMKIKSISKEKLEDILDHKLNEHYDL